MSATLSSQNEAFLEARLAPYVDAVNRHDINGIMGCFAKDLDYSEYGTKHSSCNLINDLSAIHHYSIKRSVAD